MKRIYLSLAVLCSTLSGFAQFQKGDIVLGGGVYLSGRKYTTTTTSHDLQLHVSPSIGFAPNTHTLVGVHLLYGSYRSKYAGSTQRWELDYGGGLFLRRLLPLGKGFFLFAEGELAGVREKSEERGSGAGSSQRGLSFELSATPGISYAVSRRFLLETSLSRVVSLGYNYSSQYQNGMRVSRSHQPFVGVNAGGTIPLHVGFRIILGK